MQCFRSAFPYACWISVGAGHVEGFVSNGDGIQGFEKYLRNILNTYFLFIKNALCLNVFR